MDSIAMLSRKHDRAADRAAELESTIRRLESERAMATRLRHKYLIQRIDVRLRYARDELATLGSYRGELDEQVTRTGGMVEYVPKEHAAGKAVYTKRQSLESYQAKYSGSEDELLMKGQRLVNRLLGILSRVHPAEDEREAALAAGDVTTVRKLDRYLDDSQFELQEVKTQWRGVINRLSELDKRFGIQLDADEVEELGRDKVDRVLAEIGLYSADGIRPAPVTVVRDVMGKDLTRSMKTVVSDSEWVVNASTPNKKGLIGIINASDAPVQLNDVTNSKNVLVTNSEERVEQVQLRPGIEETSLVVEPDTNRKIEESLTTADMAGLRPVKITEVATTTKAPYSWKQLDLSIPFETTKMRTDLTVNKLRPGINEIITTTARRSDLPLFEVTPRVNRTQVTRRTSTKSSRGAVLELRPTLIEPITLNTTTTDTTSSRHILPPIASQSTSEIVVKPVNIESNNTLQKTTTTSYISASNSSGNTKNQELITTTINESQPATFTLGEKITGESVTTSPHKIVITNNGTDPTPEPPSIEAGRRLLRKIVTITTKNAAAKEGAVLISQPLVKVSSKPLVVESNRTVEQIATTSFNKTASNSNTHMSTNHSSVSTVTRPSTYDLNPVKESVTVAPLKPKTIVLTNDGNESTPEPPQVEAGRRLLRKIVTVKTIQNAAKAQNGYEVISQPIFVESNRQAFTVSETTKRATDDVRLGDAITSLKREGTITLSSNTTDAELELTPQAAAGRRLLRKIVTVTTTMKEPKPVIITRGASREIVTNRSDFVVANPLKYRSTSLEEMVFANSRRTVPVLDFSTPRTARTTVLQQSDRSYSIDSNFAPNHGGTIRRISTRMINLDSTNVGYVSEATATRTTTTTADTEKLQRRGQDLINQLVAISSSMKAAERQRQIALERDDKRGVTNMDKALIKSERELLAKASAWRGVRQRLIDTDAEFGVQFKKADVDRLGKDVVDRVLEQVYSTEDANSALPI